MEEIAKEWLVYRVANVEGDGVCKVEIILVDDGRHVVILEDLDENPGQPVAVAWDAIVATVQQRYSIPLPSSVWIEHDPRPHGFGVYLGPWQIITFKESQPDKGESKVEWRTMVADDWHELGLPVRT